MNVGFLIAEVNTIMPKELRVKTVAVGLTPSEWRELEEYSKRQKVTRPEALRALLRREVTVKQSERVTNGAKTQ